jgi:valyl-tRNA synthetase
MPFITEELWSVIDSNRPFLALSQWPAPAFEDEAAAEEINWLIDLISAIRSVRSEMNVPAGANIPLSVSGATFKIAARLQTYDVVIRRLARIELVSLASKPVSGAVQVVAGAVTLSLPLEGVVDLVAEKARLSKELDKIDAEIAKIEAKLANEKFIARAPESVVAEQRERLAEANALRDKTHAAMARVGD